MANDNHRVTISFEQRYKVVEWLKGLGQHAIDTGRLSYNDLAERGTKTLGFLISLRIIKNCLPLAGLKASAPLVEKVVKSMGAGQGGAQKAGVLKPSLDELTAALKDCTAAVSMLVDLMERKAAETERAVGEDFSI